MPNQTTSNSNSAMGNNNSSQIVEQQKAVLEKELEALNKQISGESNPCNSMANTKTILKKSENELQLLEKRMIVYLKLKMWKELIEEGYRILGKKGPSVIAYKSVLVGLCKVGRYDEEVTELLNHWKKASPKDVEMHDTHQKMLAYQNAIRSGVNPNDLFNNLEQALGLNAEWVSNRTAIASEFYWRFRPPPKMQTTFYLCPRATDNVSGVNACMYGDKCISAHSKEELEEWKNRQSLNKCGSETTTTSDTSTSSTPSTLSSKAKVAATTTPSYTIAQSNLSYIKQFPSHALHYLKAITEQINKTKDLRNLLADQLADVKFVCNTALKTNKTVPVGIGTGIVEFLTTKWIFLIGSRQPVRTVCLLHDTNRDYFSITSAFFINSAGKNLNLIEIHDTNKVQRGRLQVLNTFVPQNMIQVLGGWPEWFYYKIELTFSPPPIAYQLQNQIFGSFRQTVMFDFKTNPKLVKHMAVEIIPPQNQNPVAALPSQFSAHSSLYASNQSEDLPSTKLTKKTTLSQILKDVPTDNTQISSPTIQDTMEQPCTLPQKSLFELDPEQSNAKKAMASSEVIRLWNRDLFDLVDSEAGLAVGQVHRYSGDGFRSGDSSESENSLDFPYNDDELSLTRENYVLAMARLLSLEVKTHQDRLSKLNLTTSLELSSNYTIERNSESFLKCSYCGQLYGRLELDSNVVDDLSLGHFILRNCSFVYLAPLDNLLGSRTKPRVYICKIADKLKSSIIISIGPRAVSELNLRSGSTMKFHIQFQLDTIHFRAMKSVLEGVGEVQLDLLFPRFGDRSGWVTFPKESIGLFYEGDLTLNMKQMEAYNAITYRRTRDLSKSIPPVIIIGAFGTGKTYTLAQCLKKLLLAPIYPGGISNRILICTNSNSGADIYLTNFIHPWLKSEELRIETAKPLRIYFADGLVQSVTTNVKQYCLFTHDGQNFRYPTKEEVLQHRIIIVTLSTIMELIQLGLEEDTFSHIIIDEAAQCLETETIQPLILAGKQTCVVLAGDHMQLSPKILGTLDISKPISLIERLNSSYPDGHPCRIVLKENYRSHNAILKFAGERFYNSQLRCASIQPVHSVYYPLTFFSVTNGEECQSEDKTSYHNMAEVKEVTERIRSLLQTWPPQWESPTECSNAIVVLTPYPEQVLRIRSELRNKGFPFINVDRVLNVQGKQFKVVFISTVRTFRNLQQRDLVNEDNDFGFFNNAKMLNTAVTRAQSLVSVVGDPISLCTVGKCSKLWQDFIQTAFENKSLYGVTNADLRELNMKLKASAQAKVSTANVYSEKADSFLGSQSQGPPPGLCLNIQPTKLNVTPPSQVAAESNFHPLSKPDPLKAVGAKITKPFSLREDDFIDKILNTSSEKVENNDSPFSHLASIWDRKIDCEIDPVSNGWSKALSPFSDSSKVALPFSSFMPNPSSSITSSIWSTDQVPSAGNTSANSSSLFSKKQNIPTTEHENSTSSNNLDGNFGGPKKLYYDQQNKTSFDEDYDEDILPSTTSLFSESLLLNRRSKICENNNTLPFDEPLVPSGPPTSRFPVAVGSEQRHRPSAAANELYEQVKSLAKASPENHVPFSQKDLFQSFSKMSLESNPKANESLYEQPPSSTAVYAPSGNTSRKPFNYEVPPRMLKKSAEIPAVYDHASNGRKTQNKMVSTFTPNEISTLLQQNTYKEVYRNMSAEVAAIDQQQMINIKAIVGPNATDPKENSSSASSTSSSIIIGPNKHGVDDTEFPSLYEIEPKKTKGSSEWVEVKKSKKTTKAQNPPTSDGQENVLTAEKKIEALQQMGFDKKKAIRALQNCDKDLERAVEYLLAGGGGGGTSIPINGNGTVAKVGGLKFPNL